MTTETCGCTCGLSGCVSRRKSGVIKHGTSGYSEGCRCDECLEAHVRRSLAQRKRVNDDTRLTAVKHGQQWTGAEMEIALRGDLTAQEAARMLGRSLSAVKNLRYRCRTEPKYAEAAGVSAS